MSGKVFFKRRLATIIVALVGCLLFWGCGPVTSTPLAPQQTAEDQIPSAGIGEQSLPTPTRAPVTTIQTQTEPTVLASATLVSSQATATLDPLAAWLENFASYLENLASEDQFSGAVLVARDEEPLLQVAYGLADRSKNIPNRIDTKFNLGSMNKMFTAVSILQLVEEGKLALDARIADVLPDYPNQTVANSVTIHQLLTHTAGMGDCFTGEFFTTPAEQLKTVGGYLPLFVDKPLQFKPGSQYAYSNEGYMVLGLIIEKITGKSYFDYVRENIYAPNGMVNTDEIELDTGVPNLAIGYTTQDAEGNETGILADDTSLMPIKGTPAGGGYSTVQDLLRFREALLSDQLLAPKTTQDLLKGKVEIRENVHYAYGFLEKLIAGQRIVGHGGNAPGVCDLMDMYLDGGYTVIVLSNSDNGCLLVREYLNENPVP